MTLNFTTTRLLSDSVAPAVNLASVAPIPDLSVLQGLPDGVAYLLLVVVLVGMILFYLSPVIRARLMPKQPDPTPAPATASPTPPPAAALPQALDQANAVSSQFIDHLLRRDTAQAAEIATLKQEVEELRNEVGRLTRLLWQRPNP